MAGGVLIRGGGGRRSKHWPPGAGDPRCATVYNVYVYVHIDMPMNVCLSLTVSGQTIGVYVFNLGPIKAGCMTGPHIADDILIVRYWVNPHQ